MMHLFDVLHVTAQYSNAVFVAVMPQFSDYTKALDLPVSRPIAPVEIRRFAVDPREPMKCALELTNGMVFWYERGHVSSFDDQPHNYMENAPSPTFTNDFFGTLNMTKDEALGLVRKSMSNLGYSVKQSLVDLEPEVVSPPVDGTNIVPHYIFKWPSLSPSGTVSAEVDGQRKSMVDLTLLSEVFERNPPKIPVTPEWRNPDPEMNPAYISALMAVVLPQVSDFARNLKLPIELPITTNQIAAYDCKPGTYLTIRLTNDYFFKFGYFGFVEGFFNKDSYFFRGLGTEMNLRMHDTTVNDYLGEWRMSDDEMAEMVRNTIRNLGRKPEDFFADGLPTTVVKPVKMGSYVIPRCFMSWSVDAQKHSGITISQVRAEVDANNKRLLAFTWCRGNLQKQEWPKIEVVPYLSEGKAPSAPQPLQRSALLMKPIVLTNALPRR